MRVQHQWWSGLVAAVLVGLMGVTAVAAGEQFLPVLGVREGNYTPTIPYCCFMTTRVRSSYT